MCADKNPNPITSHSVSSSTMIVGVFILQYPQTQNAICVGFVTAILTIVNNTMEAI